MSTLEQNQNKLDSDESLKAHPIVFFDGVCGLCNHSLDFILARDKEHVFRFAPLQGETAQKYLNSGNPVEIKSLILLDHEGEYHKSAAMVRILQRLKGFWAVCGTLLWLIPWPIRDFGYSIIAKYRYRFFGKDETCRLPKPDEKELFLP